MLNIVPVNSEHGGKEFTCNDQRLPTKLKIPYGAG